MNFTDKQLLRVQKQEVHIAFSLRDSKAYILITSDTEEDLKIIRKVFENWRNANERIEISCLFNSR